MAARLRKLRRMVPAINAELRKQLEKEAESLVGQMRAIAPRGATGRLAASIGWTWGDAPAGSFTIGKVGNREVSRMAITVYAGGGDAFYAKFHEFGTVKMPASPFFFPTYRMNRKRIRSNLTRAITRAIKKT